MNKKVILTEQQHEVIINQILKETVEKIDKMEAENRLDEGFWDTVKYALSKLGRYKAGGKILGKGKVDREYADRIARIIDKEGNKIIKDLDTELKETNPEFPNNKDPQQFLTSILSIAAVYDSIVAATKKKPDEEGYLPIDAANGVINDLREYVIKILDVDLAAVYTGLDEGEELAINEQDPLDASDVRKGLKDKRTDDGEDFKSTRMDTLKSNKLPLLLAGIGSALGGLSWLANTDWFKSLFDKPFSYTDTEKVRELVQQKSEIFTDIKDGEGVYKLLGRVTNNPLDGNSSPQDFIKSLKEIGGGDAHKGVDLLCQKGGVMMRPEDAAKGLHDLVDNPNQYKTMNDMFKGAASGTGKLTPTDTTLYGTIAGSKLTSILVKTVPQVITKVAIKTGVKTGAGYAAAKGLGSILGPLGIALITTGALVKLFRVKGQKSSRAATLNALYQSMRNLDGGLGVVKPKDASADGAAADGAAAGGAADGGATKDNLYNGLKNLFQFIVNNKNTMGTYKSDTSGRTNAGDRRYSGGQFMKGGSRAQGGGQVQTGRERFFKNQGGVRENESKIFDVLTEGKYISDKNVIKYLSKSMPFDKVKNFENLIGRVEYIRNVLKKMGAETDDKVLNNFLKELQSNPIMLTNFSQIFTVNPSNAQEVNSLAGMIKEILNTVYSSDYKFGNMVDKMATLGGGNINKIEEEDAGYNTNNPNKSFQKDAQSRTTFKKNLVKFLQTLMNMFQYLHKSRSQKTTKKQQTPVNETLNKELDRIKKIMFS
jgi:hypothetical protein